MENYSVYAALKVKDEFTDKIEKAADSMGNLEDAAQSTSSKVDKATSSMDNMGDAAQNSSNKVDKATSALDEMEDEAESSSGKVDKASVSVKNLESAAESGTSGITKFAASFAVANKAIDLITSTIKNSLGSAISRVDTMNQFPKIMEQIGFSSEESQAAIDKLSEGISGLPTSLDDITASTQSLAMLTGDLEKATDTSLALNDAFYASGASSEDAARGLTQYTQMLSKGSVDMQSWRTLQETMGVALNDLAASFGFAGESAQNDLYAALQSGEITFTQLNDRLIELDGGVDGFATKAKTASEGIATSFGNLGTAVTRGVANVIDATDKALKDNGLPGFQDQIEGVKNQVNKAFDAIKKAAGTLTSVMAPAVKLVNNNLKTLKVMGTTVVAGFVAFKAVKKASDYLDSFRKASANAVKKLDKLEKNLYTTAAAQGTMATAEVTTAGAVTASNVAITAKELLLGVLAGKIKLTTAAQLLWNQAMAANPIGTVIVAATALVTVLGGVLSVLKNLGDSQDTAANKTETLSKQVSEHLSTMEDADKTYRNNVRDVEAQCGVVSELAEEYSQLAGKSNRTSEEKERLSSVVQQLNGQMTDLNATYDKENDILGQSAEVIERKAKSYESLQKSQVYTERLTEVSKDLITVEDDLAEAQANYNAVYAEFQEKASVGVSENTYKPLVEAKEAVDKLQAKEEEYTAEKEQLTERLNTCNAEQAASLSESIANQTVVLSDLDEATQTVITNVQSYYQDLYDKATSIFEQLSDEQSMTVDEMIQTAARNKEVTETWGSNMETLRNRFASLGLDDAILSQLESMGVDGAGYVAALVTGTDEQLTQLASTTQSGGEAAKNALLQSLGIQDGEIQTAITDMMTTVSTSLSESVAAVDWASLGGNMDSGLASGISENAEQPAEAATGMVEDTREAAGEAAGEGSPCAKWIELGENMIAGLVLGLSNSSAAITAAQSLATQLTTAIATAVDGIDYSNSFSGLASAASSGMSSMAKAVTSGMSQSTSAMASGMKGIEQKVTSSMGLIKNKSTSGMSGFRSAILVGMNAAKNAANTGIAGIVSVMNNLTSRLYNIGVYAVQGLANGINAKAPTVLNTARSLANQVASTMASALNVGSPSKVTMKIGEWTGIGLALGLKKTMPQVERVSNRLAELMIPATGPDFAGVTQRYAWATDATVTVKSASDGNMLSTLQEIRDLLSEENRTYHFETSMEVDGKKLAKAEAAYTKAELEKREKIKSWLGGVK